MYGYEGLSILSNHRGLGRTMYIGVAMMCIHLVLPLHPTHFCTGSIEAGRRAVSSSQVFNRRIRPLQTKI